MGYLHIIIVAAALFAGETAPLEIIATDDLARVVGRLSADEMEGRKPGTPQAEDAARFIAAEFQDAGLIPFEGLASYLQPFTVFNIEPVSQSLSLDGTPLADEDFVTEMQGTAFRCDDLDKVRVQIIGPNDNLRSKLRESLAAETPVLVLLDPAHRQALGFLRRFAYREAHFQLNPNHATIVVVTDKKSIGSLDVKIENKVSESKLENVVGVLPGKSKAAEILLFSAHYDHLGRLPEVNGDSIANGADDDASGVAGIIALARYFKQRDMQQRTLMFVAFTAEEMGGLGSQFMAGVIAPERIVAGINLEMIGKVSDFGPGIGYITGFERSSLGEIVVRNLAGSEYGFHPDPHNKNLFFRSDNINFARKGVPAHSFSTDPIDKDPYYHTVDDELETLDLANMTRIVRGVALGVGSIVDGTDTPSRISGL